MPDFLKYKKRIKYTNIFKEESAMVPPQITDEEAKNIELALELNKPIMISNKNNPKNIVLMRFLKEVGVHYVFEDEFIKIDKE